MSYDASGSDADLQSALLAARDQRQRELQAAMEGAAGSRTAILTLATNIPGPDKHPPGLSAWVQVAWQALTAELVLEPRCDRSDALGPFRIAFASTPPRQVKAIAMALEARHPALRLLDLDVYDLRGLPVDRQGLGAPARACLLCGEPARECIRAGRHDRRELDLRVRALLDFRLDGRLAPRQLAGNLVLGALQELQVTPKPGLVDRADPGSHPDLSFASMRRSVDLLPRYYAELQSVIDERGPLEAAVACGLAAEQRMLREVGSNAHKGYLFLSGLFLMAAQDAGEEVEALRAGLARLGSAFFARFPPSEDRVRARTGLGGIRAEVEQGLPAVFEHGWPRYREALALGWTVPEAEFYLMAVLMQQVEDTTAVQRGGLAGLQRLRRDGAALQRRLEQRRDPLPFLADLNADYRRANLTMGGVADCMALTFALEANFSARPTP